MLEIWLIETETGENEKEFVVPSSYISILIEKVVKTFL